MDEREWLACASTETMAEFLRATGRATDRKVRLFACACCRRIWNLMSDERSRNAVEVAELAVDELATVQQRVDAAKAARTAKRPLSGSHNARLAGSYVLSTYASSAASGAAANALAAAYRAGNYSSDFHKAENDFQCGLLRDIFGNPFRPAALKRAWRTPAVLALAQAAYDNRTLPAGTLEPDRLAVLADALEEVGCTDADILGHLRGPGPHVRGCFALDAILDKK